MQILRLSFVYLPAVSGTEAPKFLCYPCGKAQELATAASFSLYHPETALNYNLKPCFANIKDGTGFFCCLNPFTSLQDQESVAGLLSIKQKKPGGESSEIMLNYHPSLRIFAFLFLQVWLHCLLLWLLLCLFSFQGGITRK